AIMALLESEPFSEGESSAFSNLIAYMGPCLRAGTKLEGKPEPLRAALAEALYQRMKNPAESFAEAVTKSAQAKSK
ncbi:MAG TPA: hypothetical protein VFW35_07580, partial [Sphingomicrobium sp.]|nr:hypothetical protein [Sphingomicrobium sp.]